MLLVDENIRPIGGVLTRDQKHQISVLDLEVHSRMLRGFPYHLSAVRMYVPKFGNNHVYVDEDLPEVKGNHCKLLRFRDYRWNGVETQEYKAEGTAEFKGDLL